MPQRNDPKKSAKKDFLTLNLGTDPRTIVGAIAAGLMDAFLASQTRRQAATVAIAGLDANTGTVGAAVLGIAAVVGFILADVARGTREACDSAAELPGGG